MAEKLGQHFLNNPRVAIKIIENLDITPRDKIMEIGAGRGYLTEYLIESKVPVLGVELDSELCTILKQKFKESDCKILNRDFLKIDLEQYGVNKICGNIPYQITGKILEKICTSSLKWDTSVIMLPEPVALRVTAAPKDNHYSAVTVMAGVNCKTEYCFDVSRENFSPPPNVKSAVIKLRRMGPPEEEKFYRMVRGIFKYRRKNIRNSILNFTQNKVDKKEIEEILTRANICRNLRAHELKIENYKSLKNLFVNRKIL